jgi:succinate dehydrogenase / fumarate reductase flavoprotein subunit
MASNGMKIAIVGGGLAGLAAAMKIAEVVRKSSMVIERSHSVAQGEINGAVNTGEGDSTWEHFDDTVYMATPANTMCEMAPSIICIRS